LDGRKPYQDKASKRPTARSRELRRNMTPAERRLWSGIRARQVADARFNTQFPIGPFVCGFVSRGARLIIEVDGGQHAEQTGKDARRTACLKKKGYRLARFWNNDVLANTDGVVEVIEQMPLHSPSPDRSHRREGNS